MADQYADMSGYNYAFNDPINFNDPTGAYPDPPYGYNGNPRFYPPGAYRNTSLEEDWYNRSADGLMRQQYYNVGMGSFYDQTYGFVGRSYRWVNDSYTVKNSDGTSQVMIHSTKVYEGSWSTPLNFENTKTTIDWGGAILGAAQGISLNRNGEWLGNNGRYYSQNWGGNGATGSRTAVLKMAKVYKWAGRGTILVGLGISVYEINSGVNLDRGRFGYHAYSATASAAGSLIGGLAGAEGGAAVGAAIGVWFGGVGAIPGAVLGGIVGGIVGGNLGGNAGGFAVKYYYRDIR